MEIFRGRLDLVELEVDAFVWADLRAQLAPDTLEPVDAVLSAVRERQLDLLIWIQVGDGLAASRDETVDPGHRHERLLDRCEDRGDVPPDLATFAAPLRIGFGELLGVTPPFPVHELPLARADEAALLRPDPTGALRLDLRAELQ